MLKRFSIALAATCLSTGCGSREKTETLDRLPCVRSLMIVADDPLRVRVETSEGSGDVFIRKPHKPRLLSTSVEVLAGDTFVVLKDRTTYDFTLKGTQDDLLKFATTIVENCGVPQKRVTLVAPYFRRNQDSE
jgi:hypothetical protein